ncbi:hypothetical protein Hanom_Chr17g01548901 [Helianthus anomalus]
MVQSAVVSDVETKFTASSTAVGAASSITVALFCRPPKENGIESCEALRSLPRV